VVVVVVVVVVFDHQIYKFLNSYIAVGAATKI
jgi:hypothetical protein